MKQLPTAVLCAVLLSFAVTTSSADDPAAQSTLRFASDIQPLFAKHCLQCHGPDKAEGGLRLDEATAALGELDSGQRAIVPGNAAASQLLQRVSSSDPDLQMPPDGDRLSAADTATLKQWIEEGAEWQQHWAYRPLSRDTVPTVKDNSAVRNPIDSYVVAELDRQQIAPSATADRYTLIRRLHYDLTGLPPTPAEVEVFVQDQSADAWEKLVDRLLASPHFGERWGRHWLDKARYADSDGYEKDNNRPDAWRYRDWVIQSINDDMPFDQFTIEQLAGDMLPGSTPLQKLATAFHRQTLTNTEGGVDREQFRVAAVMDRTETLGTVWMGLSVGCARCHNHKYDQISQREYYQLYAYFNNADESNSTVPAVTAFDEAGRAERASLLRQLRQRQSHLHQTLEEWLPALKAEHAAASDQPVAFHLPDKMKISGPEGVTFTRQSDGSWLVGGANPERATYTIEATGDVDMITGLRLEVLPDESLNAQGPGRTKHGNFVLNEVRFFAARQPKWDAGDQQSIVSATANFSQDGWPIRNAFDGNEDTEKNGTGWAVSPQFGKVHTATFGFDRPVESQRNQLQIQLSQQYGSQHTIGRFRVSLVTGRLPGTGLPDEIRRIVAADRISVSQQEALVRWYQQRDPETRRLQQQLQTMQGDTMSVRVISQAGTNRTTNILRRGEFKQPLEEVRADTLAILPPVSAPQQDAASDRLDLARWLVSGRNPLPPRVAVNQIWKNLFGTGIVPTMNDFGVRGDAPSHPQLLDHLAVRFIENGWSRKSLIRYIVTSATYRQSSRHRPELVQTDPLNRLLHRQNRFRVEAEIVRDITLAASGLLSSKIGGPSVFPPIPAGVTDLTYNSSFKWNTSGGEDRYRRGMYTYFKRTAPHPNLITFDCPDSNVTSVDRDRSNTPISALVTLNNETFVEAAQAMAQHILTHADHTDDTSRLNYALQRCIVRPPTEADLADFQQLLNRSRGWYSEHADAAGTLVGNRTVAGCSVEENAAWIATLRMMLNLDEFITRE